MQFHCVSQELKEYHIIELHYGLNDKKNLFFLLLTFYFLNAKVNNNIFYLYLHM